MEHMWCKFFTQFNKWDDNLNLYHFSFSCQRAGCTGGLYPHLHHLPPPSPNLTSTPVSDLPIFQIYEDTGKIHSLKMISGLPRGIFWGGGALAHAPLRIQNVTLDIIQSLKKVCALWSISQKTGFGPPRTISKYGPGFTRLLTGLRLVNYESSSCHTRSFFHIINSCRNIECQHFYAWITVINY